MRPQVTCLTALGLLLTASSQNFNPQPQLGGYAPLGTDYDSSLGVNKPYYDDYLDEYSSYFSQGYYAPTFNAPGLDQFYGTLQSSPQRDFFGPLSEVYLPSRGLPNTPYSIVNSGLQNRRYNPIFNPRLTPNRPVYYNNPQRPFSYPQFDNYAPTFTSPLGPPLLGTYDPVVTSNTPNIIREDDDGRHTSETKTSTTNDSFLSTIPQRINPSLYADENFNPPNYPIVINGKAYQGNIPQYYPETDVRERPYSPDPRQFIVETSPAEDILPSQNLPSDIPSRDSDQDTGNSPVSNEPPFFNPAEPTPSLTISQPQFPSDRNQVFESPASSTTQTPLYPTAPSSAIPDIGLGGSPRYLGGQSVPFNFDISRRIGGFESPGLQPRLDNRPRLPNVSYEAPGREVPS